MTPIVLDAFSDICASGVCIVILIIIAIVVFLGIILWRFSGKKRVEIHTIEKPTKSGRFCPRCGREIPFDAVFCPYCQYDFK
jgi:hypothetical protein